MNEPLEIPEFAERNYKTLEDYLPADEDTVRVLRGSNHPVYRTREEAPKAEDDGARLNTPEAHRLKAVADITSRLDQSILEALSARAWMAAIGYHDEVRDALSDAISDLQHVQHLLDVHEGQK